MSQSWINELHQINYLATELGVLYHKTSLKLGITDSVSVVLYTVYDMDGRCLLSNIYKRSGISKQTVNSAIRSLETDGFLYLEQNAGKSKTAVLTAKGKAFAQKTVAKIRDAEAKAFDSWSAEEVGAYIRLTEKYVDCLRRQVDEMESYEP